jgi:hypothetical protein
LPVPAAPPDPDEFAVPSRLLKNSAAFANVACYFDDAPAAAKGLGEAGLLGHQQASAINLGSRTRL